MGKTLWRRYETLALPNLIPIASKMACHHRAFPLRFCGIPVTCPTIFTKDSLPGFAAETYKWHGFFKNLVGCIELNVYLLRLAV